MSSPTLDQLVQLVDYMRRVVSEGGNVVAHCAAGLGRTGTVLAAYLVGDGLSATEAIRKVRSLRPGSIETEGQERSVHRYAELIGGDPA
jgi:atypical dual specificity phosphatase